MYFSVMFESGLGMFVLVGVLGNTITNYNGDPPLFQIGVRMTCPHHAKSMFLLRHFSIFGGTQRYSTS